SDAARRASRLTASAASRRLSAMRSPTASNARKMTAACVSGASASHSAIAAEASAANNTPSSASHALTGSSRSADHVIGTRARSTSVCAAASTARAGSWGCMWVYCPTRKKKAPPERGFFAGAGSARGLLRLRVLLHRMMGRLLVLGGLVRGLHAVRLHAVGRRGGSSHRGGDPDDRAGNQQRAESGGNELLEHRHLQTIARIESSQ